MLTLQVSRTYEMNFETTPILTFFMQNSSRKEDFMEKPTLLSRNSCKGGEMERREEDGGRRGEDGWGEDGGSGRGGSGRGGRGGMGR